MSQSTTSLNIKAVFPGVVAQDRLYDKMTGFAALANNLTHGAPAFFRNFNNRTVVATGATVTGTTRATRTTFCDGIVMYESKTGGSPSKVGDEVSILRKGVIWVLTSGAVTAGEAVYLDLSDSGNLVTGGTKATGDITFYGLNFVSSTAAAGLALLEVNFPNHYVTT